MLRRLPRALRRPEGLVPRTRWLFLVFALLALLMSLPGPLAVAGAVTLPLVVVAATTLVVSWVRTYRTGRQSVLGDAVDCVAITAFTLSCPAPAMVFSITFCALWFHAVHGSTGRGVLRSAAYALAVLAAVPLWGLVPGHAPTTQLAPVVGTAPVMLLTYVVVRVLALGLFARERAAQRDALLVRIGTDLLGTTEHARIAEQAVAGSRALCAITPGLRSMAVLTGDGAATVLDTAGDFERVPGVLPAQVVPEGIVPGLAVPVERTAELDAAAGRPCGWVCMDLPEVEGVSVLVGAPGGVDPDVVVSFQQLGNQVGLATANIRGHELLRSQARTDALTGLANRGRFQEELAAARGERAVLFVDLDDFKAVNDGLGHGAGDELLQHVARQLQTVVRPGDVGARLGGDEFAVLLHGASAAQAVEVGERVVRSVSVPVQLAAGPARVGVSVGVVHVTAALDPEQLLHRADTAMYAAKAAGKGRVVLFGAERDGAERDGAERDGAERDGAERDGAERDGAERDGAERDGAERGGAAPAGAAR